MAKYTTVSQTALRFNLSERRVQALCHDGRIEGALMLKGVWLIPDDAKKPEYIRESNAYSGFAGQLSLFDFMTGETLFDLESACDFLGISVATGSNWMKSHRLVPSFMREGKPVFTLDSLRTLLATLSAESGTVLKSRRNKSQVEGIASYSDYLSDSDSAKDAAELVRQMVSLAKNEDDIEPMISLILAEYAIRFLIETGRISAAVYDSTASSQDAIRNKNRSVKRVGKPYICAYFRNELNLGAYEPYIAAFFTSNPTLSGQAPDILSELLSFELPFVPGQDVLGLLYISLKSLKDRKATGTYYTPNALTDRLIDACHIEEHHITGDILDPCCGTGNFLLALLHHGILPEQIYARDNDEMSVAIARINLILNTEDVYLDVICDHVICMDTLLSAPAEDSYDLILGNPPWGCHFDKETSLQLKKRYQTSGSSIESFRLFIEYALSHLTDKGVLAYVLPESFLLVQAHSSIRQMLIQQMSLREVHFVPDGFKNVVCPAILLIAGKESADGINVQLPNRSFTIHTDRHLDTQTFWNLQNDDREALLLEKMNSIPDSMYLAGNADFALGIVTGNNKDYLISAEEYDADPDKYPDAEPILKGSDIRKFGYTRPQNYINFDPSAFQQVARESLYRAPRKLIYRFISNGKAVFAYDDSGILTLNSSNICIPNIPMLSMLYILGVLNSKAADYYFDHSFHSAKLLRSHIESLPIPRIGMEEQEKVIDIVRHLMVCNSLDDAAIFYEQLNQIIYRLFDLTESEIALIETSVSAKSGNSFLYSREEHDECN